MVDIADGTSGQVENDPYCMNKSFQSRNVKTMNNDMGYHDMSDLANTAKAPTPATGKVPNAQVGPKIGNPKMNDNKGKAY